MPVQSESVNLPELLQCERIVLFPPHVSRRLHIQTLEIPYAEESDFEDDTIYTEERKPIPKIIPKKKKAPFNVEAFAKECNAYVVKQERQEEQENLQH